MIEAVEGLLALLLDIHETRLTQDGQVVGDRGLGDVGLLSDLVDGQRSAAAKLHDLLPGLIRHGFGKKNGIKFCHIDLCLYDIISINVYLSSKHLDSLALNSHIPFAIELDCPLEREIEMELVTRSNEELRKLSLINQLHEKRINQRVPVAELWGNRDQGICTQNIPNPFTGNSYGLHNRGVY